MASKEEYLQLTDRINELKERRAGLVALEQGRAEERDDLLKTLEIAGVDHSNPVGEIERLEQEIQAEYDTAKAQVDQFENELKVSTGEKKPVEVSDDAVAAAADAEKLFEPLIKGPEGEVPTKDLNLD